MPQAIAFACFLLGIAILAGCERAADEPQGAQVPSAASHQKGAGGGMGGGGGRGQRCGEEIRLVVNGEEQWRMVPEALRNEWPGLGKTSINDNKPVLAIDTLREQMPGLRAVRVQACGGREEIFAGSQLLRMRLFFALNKRGEWRLAERKGGRQLKTLMQNVRTVQLLADEN